MLEVPVPKKKDASYRMRFDAPLKAELHWKGYGPVGKRDEDAWTCVNLRPLALHTPTHTRASETRVQRVWRARSLLPPCSSP